MALQLRVNDLDSLEPIRCLFGTAAGQQASLGPQRAEQWGRLKQRLADHSAALFCGQQRLFLYMFLFKSKLCRRQPWEDRAEPLVPVSFEVRAGLEDVTYRLEQSASASVPRISSAVDGVLRTVQ